MQMKTLLVTILLMFCLNGWGQDKKEIIDECDHLMLFPYVELRDDNKTIYLSEYIEIKAVKIFMKLWSEYKQQCWDDSTVLWYRENNRFMEWLNIIPCQKGDSVWWSNSPCECKITHKTPNPFDFIDS